ncbi:MAG: CARDB domain-containing protein, partial [Phycisphaerae bacterium]|nr:CARDB domain-containing protein [Phycisphaerae bacterium]
MPDSAALSRGLEQLEARVLLAGYPGIPENLITANGFYIHDAAGHRITDVKTLIQDYAPIMRFDAGAYGLTNNGDAFRPKPVEIAAAHLTGTSYAALPNCQRPVSLADLASQVETNLNNVDLDQLQNDPQALVDLDWGVVAELRDVNELAAFSSDACSEYYVNLPGTNIYEVTVAYELVKHDFPNVIYGTAAVSPDGGKLAVQYWFYYYGNNFWNDHEGDWEGVTVFFTREGPYAAYYNAHHEGVGEYWDDLEVIGTHPVAYVAAGSHATYYHAGESDVPIIPDVFSLTDYHHGDGEVLVPGQNLQVRVLPRDLSADLSNVDGYNMSWLKYRGRWGQPGLGGVPVENDGPRGPGRAGKFTNPFTLAPIPRLPEKADLICQDFDLDCGQLIPADRHVQVSYSLQNMGGQRAGPFDVSFYFSNNDTITSSDVFLGKATWDSLPSGFFITRTIDLVLPALTSANGDNPGYVGMIGDSGNAVTEANELNNASRGDGADLVAIRQDVHLAGTGVVDALDVTGGAGIAGAIGDEWIGAKDLDVYKITLAAGVATGFDIDDTTGGLDSYLRLFNASWGLVAFNDDGAGPGGDSAGKDSYLNYTPGVSGDYYLVVGSAGNKDGDPRTLAGRSAGTTGSYTLRFSQVKADLLGAHLDCSVSGSNLTVNYTIANQGFSNAGAFSTYFYITDSQNFVLGGPQDY